MILNDARSTRSSIWLMIIDGWYKRKTTWREVGYERLAHGHCPRPPFPLHHPLQLLKKEQFWLKFWTKSKQRIHMSTTLHWRRRRWLGVHVRGGATLPCGTWWALVGQVTLGIPTLSDHYSPSWPVPGVPPTHPIRGTRSYILHPTTRPHKSSGALFVHDSTIQLAAYQKQRFQRSPACFSIRRPLTKANNLI